ncbi:MAG TPA: hypothetical protein VGR28_07155 [Candidatus Thermoplasmatota archaeon]|jgi:hypothetical protein|nr:hypothetical protein [Candidatus Thermoplasmatota archaeon]
MLPRALAAVALVLVAGCTSDEGPGPDTGVMGRAMAGPQCPVQREPPDPSCADQPYQGRLVVTTADGATAIHEFDTDAQGRFRVGLPAGDYAIRSAAANTLPRCASDGPFTVVDHAMTEVMVQCDTGIR